MAEKKKYRGIPFKYLPVGFKVCRIISAALYLTAVPPLIVGMVLSIEYSGTTACVGPLITACLILIAGLIVLLVSEHNLKKKIASGEVVIPEPGQEPAKPQAKQEVKSGVWYCPNCGHENTDAFCSECGTKRPEDIVPSKEETPVVEEKKDDLEVVDPGRAENHDKVQKILNITIPLGTVGIIAVWYALATLIDFIVEISHFFQYGVDNPGDYIASFCSSQLFEMFGLIVTTGLAAIMVVIHLTSKFNAVKSFKWLPLLPAGLMFFIPVSIIGSFIYWKANLPQDVEVHMSDKGIVTVVMGFISLGLCIAAFIVGPKFDKKNKLVSKIITAGVILISSIVLFIAASAGLDWYVAPAYVALGIFMMLAAAGNFFIKE